MSSKLKLTFVDKSVKVRHFGQKHTKASIVSGFKFQTLRKMFEEAGFNDVPRFVNEVLEDCGYKKDYDLNMWTIKTSGSSICNDEDEYDETKGRRIAVSRAKAKAYSNAARAIGIIWDSFDEILDNCYNLMVNLIDFESIEKEAIENVIETGISNPL